jgi:hypothetical protein
MIVAFAGILFGNAPTALAEGEGRPTAPSRLVTDWELAGRASYLTPPIRGGTNPFGAGFGGRLGLSLANVYLGVTVIDYLGSTDVDLATHGLLYGGEVGYGFRIAAGASKLLTIRPEVGVGGLTLFYTTPSTASATTTSGAVATRANVDVITTATATKVTTPPSRSPSPSSGSSASASQPNTVTMSNLYVQPALTVMLSAASGFVGVKGSMLVVPGISDGVSSSTWLSYGVEGQLGVRF